MHRARSPYRLLLAALSALLLPLGLVALVAGPSGAATTTFSYSGPPVAIPDSYVEWLPLPPHWVDGVASISLNASGVASPISKVTVKLGDGTCGIRHTYDADLRLYLTSPAGTTVELADRVGADGHNFCQTVFDDSAATGISSGSAPFTGTFKPFAALSAFAGQSANGTWTLTAHDVDYFDTGTLRAFSVSISTGSPATITGPATATGVVGDAFNYTPTVGGDPAPTVTLNGGSLPPGLSLDAATGAITGTPTGDGGIYAVQLEADNGSGTPATLDLVITIDKKPTISATDQTATAGTPFSYTPTVGGYPTPTVHLTDGAVLPAGLSLNTVTGEISGTPELGSDGVYLVKLKAHNEAGNKTTSFTLTVNKPDVTGLAPTITGLPQAGHTLTAHAGPVMPADSTLSYVWKADGVVIDGENGSTLQLTNAQANAHITVTITASHVNYNPETETSAATDYVRRHVANPKVSVHPGTASRGGTVEVLGQGLVPGQSYAIHYLDKVVNRTADEYGEIHYDLAIPSYAPTGVNVVTLSGVSPVTVVSDTFTVRSGGGVVR